MLKCLICGNEFKSRLSPHIIGRHKITTQEYRDMFGDVPITSVEHSKLKSKINKGKVKSEETKAKISKSKLGSTPWNKGLTKECDSRVLQYTTKKTGIHRNKKQKSYISKQTKLAMKRPEVKDNIAKARLYNSKEYSLEERHQMSIRAKKLWENPDYAKKCLNPKYGNKPIYNNIKFMSDSEMLYAKKLDELKIKYKYQAGPFKYIYHKDDTEHSYYPDFYLKELDIYLEIKYSKKYDRDDKLEDKLLGMETLGYKILLLDRGDLKSLEDLLSTDQQSTITSSKI